MTWAPLAPKEVTTPLTDRELLAHPSLDFLHKNWALPDAADRGGTGVRGKLRSKFGQLVFLCLRRYLAEERDLVSHLIRVVDTLARRCDELADAHHALISEIESRDADGAANQAVLAAVLDRSLTSTGSE